MRNIPNTGGPKPAAAWWASSRPLNLWQVGRPLILLGALLLVGALVRLLPDGGAAAWLQARADARDPVSDFVFVLAAAAFCACGVPRQVVAYSAGYVFGAGPGVALAMVAQLIGCVVDFTCARAVARDWVQARMRRRLGGRMARLDRFLSANPFAATLMLRLAPVGNNLLLNLAAGASRVAARPFLIATALGYLPQTVIFALIGGGVRIEHAAQLGVGVALFVASAIAGLVLLRRLRAEGALAEG